MNINPIQLILHLTILLGVFLGLNLLCNKLIIPDLQAQWLESENTLKEQSNHSVSNMQNLIIQIYDQQIHRKNIQKILTKEDAYSFSIKFLEPQIKAIAEQTRAELTTAENISSQINNSPASISSKNSEDLQNATFPGEETTEKKIKLALINTDEFNKLLISKINESANVWSYLGFKILYYQNKLPGVMESQSDFLTSFNVPVGNQNLVVATTWQPMTQLDNPLAFDLNTLAYAYRPGTDKIWNIQSNQSEPLPKNFNSKFYKNHNGMIETIKNNKKILHTWQWHETDGSPTLLLIDFPDNRNFSNLEPDFGWVNILSLITFFLICICWFYFFHNFKVNQENQDELELKQIQLTNHLKHLETLLLSKNQTKEKPNLPIDEPIKKQNYFIPQEQRYIDQKFDYQKEEQDILMENSNSNLLKQLVTRIRKGE